MPVSFDSVRNSLKDATANNSDAASAKALEEIKGYLSENSQTDAQKAEAEKKVTQLFGELKIDLDGDGDPNDERVTYEGGNVVIKHKDNKSGEEVAYLDSGKALKGEYRLSAAADPVLQRSLEGLTDNPPADKGFHTPYEQAIVPPEGKYGGDVARWENTEKGWVERHNDGTVHELARKPQFNSNGDMIVTFKNGDIDVRSEDGTIKKYSSDKTLREVFPGESYAKDGNHWTKKDGTWYEIDKDGKEVEVKDVHVRENGDIVVTQKDGRIEVRTKEGEIFKYKADGTLYEAWDKEGKSWTAKEGEPAPPDEGLKKRAQEHAPTQEELKINKPEDGKQPDPKPTDEGTDPARKPEAKAAEPKVEEVGRHKIKIETNGDENSAIVKKGDNLWWIAEAWIKKNKGQDYKPDAKEIWAVINEIQKLNEDKIGKNYVIQPETKLKLPPFEKESEEEEEGGDASKKPHQKQLLSDDTKALLKKAHEETEAEPKDGIVTADELNNKICELDKTAAELEKKEPKTQKEKAELEMFKKRLHWYKELMANWQKLAKSKTENDEPGFSLADLERYVEEQIREAAKKQ